MFAPLYQSDSKSVCLSINLFMCTQRQQEHVCRNLGAQTQGTYIRHVWLLESYGDIGVDSFALPYMSFRHLPFAGGTGEELRGWDLPARVRRCSGGLRRGDACSYLSGVQGVRLDQGFEASGTEPAAIS